MILVVADTSPINYLSVFYIARELIQQALERDAARRAQRQREPHIQP